MSSSNGTPGIWQQIEDAISIAGSIGTAVTVIVLVYGLIASVLLWRSRQRRHKFSRVYFPKGRDDFYEYYVDQVSGAKNSVYITSDGFNMKNTQSRRAAKLMNDAQAKAIENGATVYRFQMTSTMHLNWLEEVCEMKRKHGDQYKTFINPKFESIGNFAVIDPGTRKAVTEFMLPDIGGIAQATIARDYGFIHGHQGKADETKMVFDRIFEHPDTVELSEENLEDWRRKLFEYRMNRYRNDEDFHVFDDEILVGIKKYGRAVTYEQVEFERYAN